VVSALGRQCARCAGRGALPPAALPPEYLDLGEGQGG
jgi:hypothetical protein